MEIDPRARVIVGAAQLSPEDGAPEGPIALAAEALRLAAEDSGAAERLLHRADAVGHVATICWPYSDEPALVSKVLGIAPRHKARTAQFGGDGPGLLIGHMASSISKAQLDVALLSGAEAIATLRAAQKAGSMRAWSQPQDGQGSPSLLGEERLGNSEPEMAVGLAAPLYVYALLETAVQARTGADREAHQRAVAALWCRSGHRLDHVQRASRDRCRDTAGTLDIPARRRPRPRGVVRLRAP